MTECCVYATHMSSAATLVREARSDAGLSCRGLAARAGLPASTVSRIERGDTDPTYTMLSRVISAAGKELHSTCAEPNEAPALAKLTDAWTPHTRDTGIDWTLIRAFLDYLAQHPDGMPAAIETPPARTESLLDSLLAGIAEREADIAGFDRPRWTSHVPPLSEPWDQPGTARMVETARQETPPQLAQRNIFLAERDLWRRRD